MRDMHLEELSSQLIGIMQPSKVSQALGRVAQTPDLTDGLCYFTTLHHELKHHFWKLLQKP